jgi:hypothetical protein
MAIESVGDRYHAHTSEVQFRQHREHKIVVAGKTGKIVDENHLELPTLSRTKQSGQPRTIFSSSGLSLVGIDVILNNGESTLAREATTSRHLVVDAFRALFSEL